MALPRPFRRHRRRDGVPVRFVGVRRGDRRFGRRHVLADVLGRVRLPFPRDGSARDVAGSGPGLLLGRHRDDGVPHAADVPGE